MKATATMAAKRRPPRPQGRRRAWSAAVLAAALAAALVGACTTRQAEDILHAAGKVAYDSMKARQESQ